MPVRRTRWSRDRPPPGPRRIGAMKKLIILALLVALGVVAARRLREA
jgi:hypothetical protein